jgi:hypothetical protein
MDESFGSDVLPGAPISITRSFYMEVPMNSVFFSLRTSALVLAVAFALTFVAAPPVSAQSHTSPRSQSPQTPVGQHAFSGGGRKAVGVNGIPSQSTTKARAGNDWRSLFDCCRILADAFKSDPGKAAVALDKTFSDSIPKLGKRLADEVHRWTRRVPSRMRLLNSSLRRNSGDTGSSRSEVP